MHSRVTSLPERAFSNAFNGLLEKLGGEAVCLGGGGRESLQVSCAVLTLTPSASAVKAAQNLSMNSAEMPVFGSRPIYLPFHPSAIYTKSTFTKLQLIITFCQLSLGTPKCLHLNQDRI